MQKDDVQKIKTVSVLMCAAHFYILVLNPLSAELNSICHLLALLGAHHILHVSRVRVKHRIKSHLPFAGIIRSSPYSPH